MKRFTWTHSFALAWLMFGIAHAANYTRFEDVITKNTLSVGSNSAANSKAVADFVSTTKGLLPPRMTTAQQNAISSPTEGLDIYNSTSHGPAYYNGTNWILQLSTATANSVVLRDGSGNFAASTITAALTGNVTGNVTGNASTATALAADPSDCSANNYATAIAASGNLTCGQVSLTAGVTGTLPVGNGGTGQTSAAASYVSFYETVATTLGDLTYGGASGTPTRLAGNVSTTKKFLAETGDGVNAAAPGLSIIVAGDVPNLDAAKITTGVFPIAQGGTNNGALAVTAGGVIWTDGSKLVNVGAGSTGQVLKSTGSTVPQWGAAQGGLISDREMITNTDIEVDASGYTAYADAAGATPVDCTGGSPNSTIARSTSTPITGTGELLWTKSGSANRQGEGFSIPFTIGTADQAKVLQIDLDSIVRSGTFVAGSQSTDSDLEIYVYDVTNSTLIQPSTYKIYSNSTTLAMHTVANFQSSASGTSYRLCVHQATTVTANATVGFDNISIHPSKYVYGSPITDWAAWTPTGAWSTNTTYTGLWRRVGGDMEMKIKVLLAGAPTSANLSINMPTGYSIDTNRVVTVNASTGLEGKVTVLDSGIATYLGDPLYKSASDFWVYVAGAAGTYVNTALVTQIVPITFGAADEIEVYLKVPIAGWGATVQMSTDADTRVVSVALSGSSTSITSSGVAIVPTTVTYDTHSGFSGSTYTIPVPGYYRLEGTLAGGSTAQTAGQQVILAYKKNGGSQVNLGMVSAQASATITLQPSGSITALFAAGDTIQFFGQANATQTVTGFLAAITRVSGPSAIAMSEVPSACYQDTSGQATTANVTNYTYNTRLWDSHTMYSGGLFTLPAPGKYLVTIAEYISSGTNPDVQLYKNGSKQQALMRQSTTSVVFTGAAMTTGVTGDTLSIRSTANSTRGTSSSDMQVCVTRVAN